MFSRAEVSVRLMKAATGFYLEADLGSLARIRSRALINICLELRMRIMVVDWKYAKAPLCVYHNMYNALMSCFVCLFTFMGLFGSSSTLPPLWHVGVKRDEQCCALLCVVCASVVWGGGTANSGV